MNSDGAGPLDTLLEIVGAAAEGNGASVLVTGEAGAGKTRLADELCRQIGASGGTVLWASGDAVGAPGFWPWLQFLRQYMRQHPDGEFSTALQERMAEIIEMAPGVDDILNGRAVPEVIDVEGAPFRLFDAVAQVLRQAGKEDPLLVVLDDLQATDDSSLALLRHVCGELWESRVVLVKTGSPRTRRIHDSPTRRYATPSMPWCEHGARGGSTSPLRRPAPGGDRLA